MLPFGMTILATVPQGSEIPDGLMNYPGLQEQTYFKIYKDGINSNVVKHKFVRLMRCAQLHSIHKLKE